MSKLPYMQFFPSDWLRDTKVLSPEAKAVWIDILALAWNEPERGVYKRPIPAFCREHQLDGERGPSILEELKLVATVTISNHCVTVISRRMIKEEKHRESNRIKVNRFRSRAGVTDGNQNVTHKKSEVRSQKSEVINNKDLTPLPPFEIPEDLKPNEPEIREWLAYKKQKGQNYKSKGLEVFWRMLRKFPHEHLKAIIEQSMANNWAGLFELKNGGQHGRQGNSQAGLRQIGAPERADSKFAGIGKTIRVGGDED